MSEPRLPFDDETDASPVRHSSRRRVHQAAVRDGRRGVQRQPDLPTTPARAHTPSIPRRTSSSRRRPAPARRACSWSATSTCCAPASSPTTSSPITFTRKAAAEMRQRIVDRLKEASRLSEFDAARWRDLKERLGDIAVSTIDAFCLSAAARVPARGRRRSRIRPGGRHRGAAGSSTSRSIRRCASAAASRETTTTWRWCSRSSASGGCAPASRRCWIAGSSRRTRLRRFLQTGPRDLTAAIGVPGVGRAAARHLRRRPRRAGRVPRRRPAPSSAVRDAGGGHQRAVREIHNRLNDQIHNRIRSPQSAIRDVDARGSGAFRALIDRLRAYFLTQEGKPRGEKFTGTRFIADDCDSSDAWKRHRAAALADRAGDCTRRSARSGAI